MTSARVTPHTKSASGEAAAPPLRNVHIGGLLQSTVVYEGRCRPLDRTVACLAAAAKGVTKRVTTGVTPFSLQRKTTRSFSPAALRDPPYITNTLILTMQHLTSKLQWFLLLQKCPRHPYIYKFIYHIQF